MTYPRVELLMGMAARVRVLRQDTSGQAAELLARELTELAQRIESEIDADIAARNDAIRLLYRENRTAEQIATVIVAAIEYRKRPSGEEWTLREGFSLGLREQWLLARKVLEASEQEASE